MIRFATVCAFALQQPETIHWAASWDEAAARSVAEKKPILAHAFFQGALDWDEQTAAGEFALPEVIALVNERYVALKLGPKVAVPFADRKLYGMSEHTFGTALLIVAPDGRVVADRYGPAWEVLVEGLTAIPELPGPPAPKLDDPFAQAQAHLRRGELAAALALATPIRTAAAQRSVAHMHALARDGERALAAILGAKQLPGFDAIEADVLYDEVDLLVKVGRAREARAKSDEFVKARPGDPRCAELSAFVAALDATPFPPETFRFTPPSVVESMKAVAFEPLPVSAAARAAAEGADWLVRTQCDYGGWSCPSQYGSNLDPALHPLAVATSALCMEALLAHAERPGAAVAIRKATRFLAHVVEERRKSPFPEGTLDYTPWAWSTLVGAFARAGEGDAKRRAELAATTAATIEGLAACVTADGGFTYITGQSLTKAARVASSSSVTTSFTTAFALHALLDARDADVPVEAALIDGAVALLEKCRGGDGAFSYVAAVDPLRDGAALRGPLCVHALLRAGTLDESDLRAALAKFRERLPVLTHERGRALMHCGPQAEGSHWILFDLWTAAAAAHELPADERAPWRALLVPEILAARRVDGAFCDMPLLGPACGTAQALLALERIAR